MPGAGAGVSGGWLWASGWRRRSLISRRFRLALDAARDAPRLANRPASTAAAWVVCSTYSTAPVLLLALAESVYCLLAGCG